MVSHICRVFQMLPGYENLLFAHSSWYTYAATMRIYKHWDFKLSEPHTATGKLSFSSYPGIDWFIGSFIYWLICYL